MESARLLRWPMLRPVPTEDDIFSDPREAPMYTVAEVALYAGVHASTLHYWLEGTAKDPAPIRTSGYEFEGRRLSFSNLLEAHILLATRQRNIPLTRVRKALAYLREQDATAPHPLLSHDFYYVDGCRDMFVRAIEAEDPINVSRHGQPAFGAILNRYLKRIEWDKNGPVRLFPIRTERVVIDVNVSGGQPVVKGTGITAAMLVGRFNSGESVRDLAKDYRLKAADVEAAIRYIQAA